ncbi:MAG: Holliday junction branch migration protein RuvA [Coriobacteriales bacterium]|jgi:Holliday junction DNA helicase RuvA
MISFLRGKVFSKSSSKAVIDVNGVGYEVMMSSRSINALPAVGDDAMVYVSMQVREDGISLFGFIDESERFVYEKLITVSSVGPKVAISALSSYPADELMRIISTGDVTKMTKVPGIGKKMAQRIIIDLKNAFEVAPSGGIFEEGSEPSGSSEAMMALLSMGFTTEEAELALKGYTGKDDLQEIVKYALKRLGSV